MKYAYMIAVHEDPAQVARLVNALNADSADFYIHVDKKADIRPFQQLLAGNKNVYWATKQYTVGWAGYTQMQYILENLKAVKESGVNYQRVFSLTGLDYPIYSVVEMQTKLDENDAQWVGAYNITQGADKNQMQKVTQYWFWDSPFHAKVLRRAARIGQNFVQNLLKVFSVKKQPYLTIERQQYEVYHGSDYWCLTYDAAMYVYEQVMKHKEIRRYFRTSYAPSELFVQTILYNSAYREQCVYPSQIEQSKLAFLTPLHYQVYDSQVHVFDETAYEDIIASGKMFFRKARTGVSDKLIEMLEARKRN